MKELLTVITGPMFSGKSSELIRMATIARIARQKPLVFKPVIDNRYKADRVCAHNGAEIESVVVADSVGIYREIVNRGDEVGVVYIDEAQFFDDRLCDVVEAITHGLQRRVVAAGLNLDFRGEPFGPMPGLLARANEVVSLSAVCVYEMGDGGVCGQPAYFTQRLVDGRPANYNDPIVMVGASEDYTVRCGRHHEVPGRRVITI